MYLQFLRFVSFDKLYKSIKKIFISNFIAKQGNKLTVLFCRMRCLRIILRHKIDINSINKENKYIHQCQLLTRSLHTTKNFFHQFSDGIQKLQKMFIHPKKELGILQVGRYPFRIPTFTIVT